MRQYIFYLFIFLALPAQAEHWLLQNLSSVNEFVSSGHWPQGKKTLFYYIPKDCSKCSEKLQKFSLSKTDVSTAVIVGGLIYRMAMENWNEIKPKFTKHPAYSDAGGRFAKTYKIETDIYLLFDENGRLLQQNVNLSDIKAYLDKGN